MKNIDSVNFQDKKVLMRVDFNVPLNDKFEITDDTRLKAAIPTITKILNNGGALILMSHLGRPKGGYEEKFSLMHLVSSLKNACNTNVHFADNCIGNEAIEKADKLNSGEILLLENLRFHSEEKEGDLNFAKKLSQLANVYVNDAFGTAHRAHASTSVIAQFFPNDKYAGYILENEIVNAQKVLDNVQRPYTAIMGGAKISDKILIIEKLLDKVDNIIIGGGMSYTFFKAMGGNIGSSLVENDKLDLAKKLMERAKEKNVNMILPIDSLIAAEFSNDTEIKESKNFSIPDGWMGLDIGNEAVTVFKEEIEKSKTILWNGPMGVFEMSNFSNGTNEIAKSVVKATENGAFSLIGGGDSAAAVNQLGYGEKVSYVSTGGGALLEYMEGKELPGVAALNN